MERNLTTGSVFQNLLYFSLPYMLSFFLQTLYGMADLFIIGQFHDTACITAVSIGSQTMHMLTVMIVGLAMGATVTIGRAVGEGNGKKAANIIGNAATVFLLGALILMAALLLFVGPIVSVMSTPDQAVLGTRRYLTICFLGIPFITAYNVLSSVFRGLGDSKSPMCFIAVACVVNIALDYLLIGGFGMGPEGAALGTVLSQTVSVMAAFFVMRKKKAGIFIKKSDFKLQRAATLPILKIGVPVALQDGFIQIAFLVITVIANSRGLHDAAAVGIVEKVIGVMFLIPSSMLSAVSALAAQNLGANEAYRARLTLRYAIWITVGFGIVMSVLAQFKAEAVIGIFEKDAQVIRLGGQYLKSYVWDCIFAGVHFCYSGYFCACGHSGISFFHNSVSIIFVRIPVAYWASKAFSDTLFPMGVAAPAGSALSVLICVAADFMLRDYNFKRKGS